MLSSAPGNGYVDDVPVRPNAMLERESSPPDPRLLALTQGDAIPEDSTNFRHKVSS